jgi:anti-sigma regulatory factor (Ser/Thr protein kinase)
MSARPLLRHEMAAQAEELRGLRAALCSALERLGVDAETRSRLVLAVDEAAANVIRHAYANCTPGRLRVTLSRHRGMLRIVLRDFAPPVDPGRVRPRDLTECRPGGLGINFIDETMDSWRLRPRRHGDGNVLVMRKRMPRGSA